MSFIVESENGFNSLSTSLDSVIKAEDSAHVSGDKGIMALGVVNTLNTLLAAEGDYAPIKLGRFGEVYVNAGTFYVSNIVVDSNGVCWEQRISYIPSTGTTTITFRDAETGATGTPTGDIVFADESILSNLTDIATVLLGAHQNDTQADDFQLLGIGGKSVTAESYIPNYDPDSSVKAAFDKVNGRLLVQDDKIEETVVEITITSPGTAWVPGTDIDLRGYQRFSFFPEVTTSAGTYAEYKVQWSFDNVNWFDETIDVPGAIASTESLIDSGTMVRRFDSALGIKTTKGITLDKKARYVRIAQRSDTVATIATKYRYQKIRN